MSFDPAFDPPDDVQARIKAEMRPDERLIWAAGSGRLPSGSNSGCLGPLAVMTPISWVIGIVGLAYAVQPQMREGVAAVVGVAGIIFGFLFTFGLIASAWEAWKNHRRPRSLYALTDARVILWEPQVSGRGITVSQLPLGEILRVWRVEHPTGLGDVVFRVKVGGPPTPDYDPRRQGFYAIPEARRVEDLVRQHSRQARSRRRSV